MLNKGLNTKQVGNLFNVDESTVRRWALSGKIKCSSSAGGHRKLIRSRKIKNTWLRFSRVRNLYMKQKQET